VKFLSTLEQFVITFNILNSIWMEAAMRTRLLLISLLALTLTGTVLAADPFVGTWKTNASQSKLAQVGDWMKQATVTFGEAGGQFTFDYKGILMNGSSFSNKGDRPLAGGIIKSPLRTERTLAYVTVIGPGEAYVTTFQNGKQTVWDHYVVSKDGKTLTITTKGTDAKGKPAEALYVLDRQ
jgi:hypothetical protein